MKKITIFLFCLIIVSSLFAYNNSQVDSLYKRLNFVEDSLKADILNELSWKLRNSDPEKAISYGLQAISLAEKFGDNENLVQAHGFIGVAYRILGNYSESIDFYYKGLELAKKYGELEQEGYAYINIGNLNIYQEYYYNAIENLNKALRIATNLNHKRMLGYIHLNIGRAKMLKKEHLSAIESFNTALDLRMEISQISGQAVCYKYIGDNKFKLGNYTEALRNYEKSLNTVDKNSDKDLCANIYTMISKVYYRNGYYGMAKKNAEKSMKVAREIGAKLIIRDNFKILSDINLKTGNYRSASQNLESIIKYNDTLFNQQLSEKIFNLEYKFEKQRKQSEIDLLNKNKKIKELELRRARTYNAALLIVLVSIISIFIYALITLKYKRAQNNLLEQRKKELDNINSTKDKMFLIISHDLRGPIGNLKTLIEMLLEDEKVIQSKELFESFNVFMKSIQSVSDLLENLLFWAKSQRGEVSFAPEIFSLNVAMNKVLQLFRTIAGHKNINIDIAMKENFDVYADKNMILTIIRNLISNALKFTRKGGTIEINVERNLQFNKVSVKDTGVGFDEETSQKIFDSSSFYTTSGTNHEAGSGLGMLLCKEFIEKNNGNIWAESEPGKGSTFHITIPATKF